MALITPVLISGVGFSAPIILPQWQQMWVGGPGFPMLVNFSGGGPAVGTVSVQVSCDPNVAFYGNNPAQYALARWNLHDVLQGLTNDKNDSVGFCVYAARLWCSAYTSGTIQLQVGWVDQR